MPGLWERLDALRAIVDTARAEDLEREPDAIRTRYEPYAEAYFVIEAVRRVQQRVMDELRAGRSVTGYLSADFGYGKTATAVYLWKRCLDGGVVAVPPFLFRQLKDIMDATKGWLAYQLQHTCPGLTTKLRDAYLAHAERSVQELAREIAAKQDISEGKAQGIVEEHIARRRDVTTTQSLLDFLRDATEIAQEAGYKGLAVFADELQDFLRTEEGARGAVQTLSEVVKGVRAMASVPLALMLTMPTEPTEAAIEEQAGDIMHRMRERGTGLQLQDAYGRQFPQDLWEHLCTSFGNGSARAAADKGTLESLGQLCERKDLSNGPRTVINALKRVAQYYQQNHRVYTPVDLMDDYLQGHIVFEGREAKLTGTLRRLLELPAAREDQKRQETIRLLAAFPRGVDEAKAGALYTTIQDLADREQWLGEHITQLAEGYALVGLQERAEARPILDEIVRDFRRRWHHAYTEDRRSQLAGAAFFQEVLPMLFPPRGQGQYANFGGYKSSEGHAPGVAYVVLNGSFERLYSRFPDRRVCVSVSTDASRITRFQLPDEDIDLDFRFFLALPDGVDSEASVTRIATSNQDPRVDFNLDLRRTFGRQFPSALAFLHDIMAPERTSAEVLLGLSMRMWGWLEEHSETSEADRQMIEAQRGALHRYALQLLLPDAGDAIKVQAQGIEVSGAEQRLVESAFEAKCAELYPNYKPLMVTKEWRNQLRRYRDALGKRPLSERRGRQPFVGTKDEIASAFGWSHTVFESSARNLQWMGILTLRDWRGRGADSQATVLMQEHPLEELLRKTVQDEGRSKTVSSGRHSKRVKSIEVSHLQAIARRQGYLADEVDEALELLTLRQYLQRESDGTAQEFAGAVDADELAHQAQQTEGQLAELATYFPDEMRRYERLLQEAGERLLDKSADEVALDATQRDLHEIQVRLDEFVRGEARALAGQLGSLGHELERRGAELAPRELEQQVTGTVQFVHHVDNQRKVLGRRFRQLGQEWEQLEADVGRTQRQAQRAADVSTLCAIAQEHAKVVTGKEELEARLAELRPYLTGVQRWREVVAKATALRECLQPESPLANRLGDALSTSVGEMFAVGDQALLEWERFKADIDALEAEVRAEESRRRNEFYQTKEQYEQALGRLLGQRMVEAAFDPQYPHESYQVLYQGVLRKLHGWLDEQLELAERVLNEFDYLKCERGIKAGNERNLAKGVVGDVEEAGARLNQGLVERLDEYQGYCEELGEIRERVRRAQEKLASTRAAKRPPTDEEKPLLEVLTNQRRSLEDLRRHPLSEHVTVDELFERLKGLYRKGHIELEVRKRE